MFNRPLCDNSCDRCGAEVTTILGKDYCSSCKPSVLKAVSNLQSEPTYKRSSRKSQRTQLLIREIEGVVDSGSNCDLVNDEFLMLDLQVRSKPIGGIAGTGLSKKRGKIRAWIRGKKDGVKTCLLYTSPSPRDRG